MTEVEASIGRQRWRFFKWPIIWLLALVAIVLGAIGLSQMPSKDYTPTAFDITYRTLHLFFMGAANYDGPLNWKLEVARFLAPGIMAYTALQALLVLFREQITMMRLRCTKDHVVICGLGKTGFKITKDFLRRKQKVIVIEEESENDWIRTAEDLGATVLIGDATESLMLRQARVEHARLLVVVCGADGTNVEAAIRAFELKGESQAGPVLECHVHIVEDDLRALFKEHRIFTDAGDRCSIALFNVYETSARVLLHQHPLDREFIARDDPRTVHLIVMGLGQMGESLLVHAARTCHFANGKRLRVTVIDNAANARQRRFLRRHPCIRSVCDMKFLSLDADAAETLTAIADLAAELDTLATVAVCFDDDANCLSFALALLPKVKPLGVPILLRMSTDGGLATLLDTQMAAARLAGLVKPFPLIGLSSERELLLLREMDAGAIAIHADFVLKRKAKAHNPNDPALLPWEQLDEDLKDSNRQQADHHEVKLRAIGMMVANQGVGEPVLSFTPEQVEVMAEMEHARWNAERFLAGWTHAPGEKNVALKTSPYLVPWTDLPEEIREYDREPVRHLPEILKLSGRQVVAAPKEG